MSNRILCIDPGVAHTGVVVMEKVDGDWQPVHFCTITTKKADKKLNLRAASDMTRRIREVVREIKQIIRREEWRFPHQRKHYRAAWGEAYIKRLRLAAAYGFPISDQDAANLYINLLELANNLDVWIVWVTDDTQVSGPYAIPLDVWRKHFSERLKS